jgi:hypothetical protein
LSICRRKDREHYIAVRTGSAPMPPELRNLEHKVEEGVTLSGAEKRLLADSFDNWKQQIFAEPTTLHGSHKGFRFVRRELLAKANQPRLLANVAHYKALRGAGHVVSETNNAVRTALLYLAPKYAIPNIGGNVRVEHQPTGLAGRPELLSDAQGCRPQPRPRGEVPVGDGRRVRSGSSSRPPASPAG